MGPRSIEEHATVRRGRRKMGFASHVQEWGSRRWQLVVLALLAGCTHVVSVGGGSRPGEFYAVAERSFLFFPGPDYIVRCEETVSGTRELVHCERVIMGADFGRIAPANGV